MKEKKIVCVTSFSPPPLVSFSEYVFEHVNPQVLRGPHGHFFVNLRAYFGEYKMSYLIFTHLVHIVVWKMRLNITFF